MAARITFGGAGERAPREHAEWKDVSGSSHPCLMCPAIQGQHVSQQPSTRESRDEMGSRQMAENVTNDDAMMN
jgi:hypothetical protein